MHEAPLSSADSSDPTRDPPLAIVAFAMAPGPGGAEANVNLDLARRLDTDWRGPLLTVSGGDEPMGLDHQRLGQSGRTDRHTWALQSVASQDLPLAARLLSACERQGRRRRLSLGRLVGRMAYERRGDHLKYLAWERALEPTLRRFVQEHDTPVLWSRALPLASLTAAHRVLASSGRDRNRVRWIVNLNDPCPPGLWPGLYPLAPRTAAKLQRSFERVLPRIDAITSPSRRLLEVHTAAYPTLAELPARIVPHAVPPLTPAAQPPERDHLTLGFAGRLRHDMVSASLTEGLERFARERPRNRLRLRFHLTAPSAPLERLARSSSVPIEIVPQESTAVSIDEQLQLCDALLDLEADVDAPLMLTKVVAYARFDQPIVAIGPTGGTTASLIDSQDVGWHAAHDDADAIAHTLAAVHDRWSAGGLPRTDPDSRWRRLPRADHALAQVRGLIQDLAHDRRGLCGPDWP